jgi:hypothetical protein
MFLHLPFLIAVVFGIKGATLRLLIDPSLESGLEVYP